MSRKVVNIQETAVLEKQKNHSKKSIGKGNDDIKFYSLPRMVIYPYLATMICYYSVGYGEPQARSGLLCSIKWIENVMKNLGLNAATGIGNLHRYGFSIV